ncbi:Uu.00g134580.m01.CDS01 [Anthostomella pinea]|uniref:Uu.00g134580.m01.CDS01 n=1 Tax=Anthostomella pinea TaxID=933095 RepID=A0AAI8YKQ3_9PEZI|nr:Uu.00g134580.m01.CDS01 [Anthostomella pinea]
MAKASETRSILDKQRLEEELLTVKGDAAKKLEMAESEGSKAQSALHDIKSHNQLLTRLEHMIKTKTAEQVKAVKLAFNISNDCPDDSDVLTLVLPLLKELSAKY